MTTQLIILDEIGARLANMTVENGYSETLGKLRRARLKPFKAADLPSVNYWPSEDLYAGKANGKDLHEFAITVEMHTLTRDEPFTDVAFRKGGDIVTALFRSTVNPKVSDTPSLALGGLVSSVEGFSVLPMIGEGQSPWCGVLVTFVVKYNTEVGDVFSIVNF